MPKLYVRCDRCKGQGEYLDPDDENGLIFWPCRKCGRDGYTGSGYIEFRLTTEDVERIEASAHVGNVQTTP